MLALVLAVGLLSPAEAQRERSSRDEAKKEFDTVPLEQLPRRQAEERVRPTGPPPKEIFLYRAVLELEVDGKPLTLSRIADCGGWKYPAITSSADLRRGIGRRVFSFGQVLSDGSAVAARVPNSCPPTFERDGSLPIPKIRQFHPDDRVTVFWINNAANPTEILVYGSPAAYSAPQSRIRFLGMRGEPASGATQPDPPDQFAWLDGPAFSGARPGTVPTHRWSAAVLIPGNETIAAQVGSLRRVLEPKTDRPTLIEAITSFTDSRSGKKSDSEAQQRAVYARLIPGFSTLRGGSRAGGTSNAISTRPEYGYPVWEGRSVEGDQVAKDPDAALSPVPEPDGMRVDFRNDGLVRLYRDGATLTRQLSDHPDCKISQAQGGQAGSGVSTTCYRLIVDGQPVLINDFRQRILFPDSHPNAWRFRVMPNWLSTYQPPGLAR